MTDIVTYCSDTSILVEELKEKFPQLLTSTGEFNIEKTPTIRNGDETLALVRTNNLELLEQLDSLIVLGTFEDIKADPEKLEAYDRIYPREPITYLSEDQQTVLTYEPPFEFAKFFG